jgi:hypothetical protein
MKILLKELISPNTAVLNDTQKAVLLIVHIAPTERVAFDNTSASENLHTARNTLIRLGALNLGDNAVELTSRGRELMNYHNLIDEMGELTDDGNAILDDSKEVSLSFNMQSIKEEQKFPFLKSLIS